MQSLPPNPYIPDQPAQDATKFFGRERSLTWMANRLAQHALIVVHGPPRIGISSLLLLISQRLSDQYQASYILVESQSPQTVLSQVAKVIASAVGLPAMDSHRALREALSDSIHDTERKPVLIALDGLAVWERRAKTDLLNALALLASSSQMIRFVVGWGILSDDTLTRDMPLRLDGLAQNIAPIAQLRLGPLTRLQSSQLITQTAAGLLRYDFNAIERIWQEANGRPHALQLLGFAVYARRALSGRVSARDVQQAIDDAVVRLSKPMAEQWQYLTRQEQLMLAAAATLRGEHGLLSTGNLLQELSINRLVLTADEARDALAHLVALDIFEAAGMLSFRFSSGLLRDWAISQANLHAVAGRPLRPYLPPGLDMSPQRRALLLRLISWTLLLIFIAFVVMGPAMVASLGVMPTPAATVTPILTTPTRASLSALPLATPTPQIVMAYMFRKTDKERWRIYVAGPDGTNATALTNGLADDQWPAWSPNGSKIAFSSNRDGNWEVYVMNADGSEQLRLTRHLAHDWSPTWSPDGLKLVFSSFRDRNWEIYSINADGSSPTRLTDEPAEDHAPVWSPDGRVIAFASKRTGNYEIYLMNPDGSAVTRLTQSSANSFAPTWSPDGRRIAFETFRDGNWEIYSMNGDGSNVVNLTKSPSADQSPAWSPDGQFIAFQSNREGATDIWIMRADGSNPLNWTHGGGNAQNPSWRPMFKK